MTVLRIAPQPTAGTSVCHTHSLMAACCAFHTRLQDPLLEPWNSVLFPVSCPRPSSRKPENGHGSSFGARLVLSATCFVLSRLWPVSPSAPQCARPQVCKPLTPTSQAGHAPRRQPASPRSPRAPGDTCDWLSAHGVHPHCRPHRCPGLCAVAHRRRTPRSHSVPACPGVRRHPILLPVGAPPQPPTALAPLPARSRRPGSNPRAEAWLPLGQTVGRPIAQRFHVAVSTHRSTSSPGQDARASASHHGWDARHMTVLEKACPTLNNDNSTHHLGSGPRSAGSQPRAPGPRRSGVREDQRQQGPQGVASRTEWEEAI